MNEIKDYEKYHKKSTLNKALNTLEGILKGIKLDKEINIDESNELKNWLINNYQILNIDPFKEILDSVQLSLDDNILTTTEIENILWLCEKFKNIEETSYYDVITNDIQILNGLLHGILSDNTINDEEIKSLNDWIIENENLKNTYPYEEVYSLLIGILSDGKITENEKNILKVFFSEFIDTTTSYNVNQLEIDKLKKDLHINGICCVDPEMQVKGKTFCFTGKSSKTSRAEFETLITRLGGFFNNNIVKNTDYLVVGNECNPCWAFSCYGRKIEKAMELRKTGNKILIIHENDFWDCI